MKIEEYLNKDEWKNITPYIHCSMSNLEDGIDWNISLSLYTDMIKMKMLGGGTLGIVTAEGIILNQGFRYKLRLVPTRLIKKQDYHFTNKGFMILAKKR